ncbi:MAG TPA: extracellular solute-binding protein [Bryobacteraceae bacterium]|nr:extracellular solute-binding protein [Bryobacteraceae bacterium]
MKTLKVALIAGGMYDQLYECIPEFERESGISVSIDFRGTHPELNPHLAGMEQPPYDLVSTHTKYAPSQQRFLAPLEGFDVAGFFPALLALATIDGALYGIPRNIDLRLLHYRTDLLNAPPCSWDELREAARRLSRPPEIYGFVFTGTESGLFGTFFELAEAAGAHIFPNSLIPEVNNEGGRWALGILRDLYISGAVPKEVSRWHFDEVHQFFRNGGAAMVTDWPGYYGSYRADYSSVRDRFRVARMPSGPLGRVCCYAGSHTFALTRTGAGKEAARLLLRFLTSAERQSIEARQGSVPVRRIVMEEQQHSATDQDAERLRLLSRSIETDLIIPPKLSYYPEIEDILWRTVRTAMIGEIELGTALEQIERKIAERVAHAA